MIAHDIRHALKAIARRPWLSLAVLMILTLGIGSTTALFSIASSVLLSEIPYQDGDRLVVVKMLIEQEGTDFPASYLDVDSWKEQSRTLELISASSNGQQLNLTGDRAERVGVGFVSSSYFDLLGARPVLGRTFRPEDENPASPPAVAVLSHGFWKRRFGGSPAIVGQGIQVHGLTCQVLGVLPEGFRDIYPDVDLYVPVTLAGLTHRPGYIQDRVVRWLEVFARRRPGVSVEQADQEMRSLSRQLAGAFPASNEGYAARVEPLRTYQFDFERMRLSIVTLLVGAVFVLLVGCANVTNLLLIRAVERRREVALRLALGVSRFRLIRSFVLEGAILCGAGALLGVGAAFFAVRLLSKYAGSAFNLPAFMDFSLDLRSLGATTALAILISLLIGVIPARKSLKLDLQEELQSEGKGHSQDAGTALARSFLVVSAVFFSVVLLIGAGLMIKSLTALIRSDPGFRLDNVLTARFELPAPLYTTDEPAYLLYRQVMEKARDLPEVEDAGLWAPAVIGSSYFVRFVVAEGRSLEAPEDQVKVYEHRISPNALRTVGIPLLKGRELTNQDDAGHPLVVIVSRSAAEAIWPGQDPIGKRLWTGTPHDTWAEVVGVVPDVDQRGRLLPDHEFRRDVYFPLFQMRSRTASILVRAGREGGETGVALSRMMQATAPDVPVFDVKTLQERRRDEEAGVRLNTLLLIFFASSALVLAAVGIYSILAYIVRQQSFEIGIRMAVGADRPAILRHFVWKGAALLVIGLLAGLAFTFVLARTMSAMLFNVSPYDPLVFLAAPCIIALFSLPAILRPAARATKADPSSLFRLN